MVDRPETRVNGRMPTKIERTSSSVGLSARYRLATSRIVAISVARGTGIGRHVVERGVCRAEEHLAVPRYCEHDPAVLGLWNQQGVGTR